MNRISRRLLLPILLFLAFSAHTQTTTDTLISEGESRLGQNQKAQSNIDKLHENTRTVVEEYQSLLKIVDGLKVYNKILAKQLDDQQNEMNALESSIANAAVIERQILPLLTRMLDGLEDFIQLDVPFLYEERMQRVNKLRRLITVSEISNAEKTRRVFEAYQIENDFGHTIESYKGKLNLGERTYDVDYLRVGRVSYLYRTVGSDLYGYWDEESETWVDIDESIYKRNIDKGIKMSRQELAPELLTIPVSISGGRS